MPDETPPSRPAASGHRFGPDLVCSVCGITWGEHQGEPKSCSSDDATPEVLSEVLPRIADREG